MRRFGIFTVVALTMGAVLVVHAPLSASSQGTLTISPSTGLVEKSYPAIPTSKPMTSTLYAQARNCETGGANSTTCDRVDLKIQVPKAYKEPFYKVRVELHWDRGATANDITLWVFDFLDPALGPTVAADYVAGKAPPRVVQFFEPDKSALYYMSIVNHGPGPTSYKIKVSWIVSSLSFPDEPRNDETEPSSSPISSKTTAPTISGSDVSAPLDGEETVTVRVPGPDGELIDVEIPLVKAAGLSKKAEKGSSPVVPIILGLLGLGLALFLYFFVWRRRRGEAT